MEKKGEKMPEDFMERMERAEMPVPHRDGMGVPGEIQSSSDVITEDFHLTRGSKTFSNVSSVVNQVTFSDVTEQNWFYEAVTAAAAQGILQGESETIFAPKETMTRGETLEALYALAGKPAAGEAAFKDLSADASCYAAAAWAEKNGILKGIAEGALETETIVTREELVQMLYQYLGDEADAEWKKTFADQDEIKAEEAFAWALDRKILSERAETLRPKDAVTKAEMATMLMAAKN